MPHLSEFFYNGCMRHLVTNQANFREDVRHWLFLLLEIFWANASVAQNLFVLNLKISIVNNMLRDPFESFFDEFVPIVQSVTFGVTLNWHQKVAIFGD